ncbi:MAG: archaellin/type IV pilin N-terminal domain-containing protein [Nanoarchaeota archaeon]|nr:archaellin/type IV pilin N-terminal domain-containing protein [Nanoarchaeota archaeon]
MKKRGLSPVIATVLLIGIVIVIGLIVFLWFKGISEEAITKFEGTNVKLICEEVRFEATSSESNLYISNVGNVPIYKMKAKISGAGSYSTEILETGWPDLGLNQGGVYAGTFSGSGTEVLLIPVLLGSTESGDKAYTCEERHGYKIDL